MKTTLRSLRRRAIPRFAALAGCTFLLMSPQGRAEQSHELRVESAESTGSAERVFPYAIETKVLENGLTILAVPMNSPGLVAYRTAVRTGARDEYEKGVTGFAHFFEHMMFRGTKRFPADKYDEMVTGMGADANAYTSTDVTVYQMDIAAEDLEMTMDIEADRFQNLSYEEAPFRTEAGAVYGEYRKNRASPFFTLYEAMAKAAFTKHTYGHTAMGYVEDIQAMPEKYEYSKEFFSRYYRPENCIVVVAGDIDSAKVFEMAERYYGSWKKGYEAPKVKKEPKQKKEKRITVPYEGRTLPMASIAYKGDAFAPSDKTWVASLVLAELAFGETSDIYKELKLQKQMVQFISASAATDRDPGLWSITTRVSAPEHLDAVLERIDATVERFKTEKVEAARIQAVKDNMKYGFLLGLDTPAAVAGTLAQTVAVVGDIEVYEKMYRTLDEVGPDEIQAAATKYLDNKQRTIAILEEAKSSKQPGAKESK